MSTVGWILLMVCAAATITLAALADRRGGGRLALRRRFGPEYDRAVARHRDRRAAERHLTSIAEKRDALTLTPLSQPEREVYAARWETLQTRFVDDPTGATHQADMLIAAVMHSRGYPPTDAAERADLLAADHPQLAISYREAHAGAAGGDGRPPDTERLRMAFVRYRDLFDRLCGVGIGPRDPGVPDDARRAHPAARTITPTTPTTPTTPRQRRA
ncbi:putative secreted protein [Frankia canadensis]|uniref:Putative secreted protein n=1 Tax=Frankia canadensis TaxID=1836972 RepID=A0A2I2KMJ9_9ACTN|nr:hypothetical protein [Frankia canadensis]SNQ46883.1 putative secreted protein [Frankia canadensis]SOU54173.1 putative secreted protein [Frankia canadensis]